MKKTRYLFSIVFSIFLLFQYFPTLTTFAQSDSANIITSRISGTDRYATSLAISQKGWTKASNVIIATGSNFPDALSASALSKSMDAPIILTTPNLLSKDVIAELKRLGASNAIIVGGTAVISASIENQLQSLGIKITRLGGTNRYDTSLKIAERMGLDNGLAVATGDNFPDALSMASIASVNSFPILLSRKDGLDTTIRNFLKDKKVPVSYIVGGTEVLNSSLDKSLSNSKRLSGSTRFETNIAINKEFQSKLNFDTVYLATGYSFPDALSGSSLAAKNNAPILLTGKDSISADTLEFLKSKNVKQVVILGGTEAVSQAVENQINASLLIKVNSVSLNKTTETLKIGESDTLVATVSPSNAINKDVTWSSSDTEVAAVDSNGKVTAKSEGTATITVTTVNGNFKANCVVTVNPINAASVSLNKTAETLLIGDTDTLIATISPSNTTNKEVTWSSSDTEVATVDGNGKVTAISEGIATITVTTVDGKFNANCVVTVNPVKAESVTLNNTAETLLIGDTDTLVATISPSNATNKDVTWSSSDTEVATVDSNGKVTAISEGIATITVTTVDGKFKADCVVTVKPINATSITLNKTAETLIVGDTDTLIATITPSNATNKDVTWSSSDTEVATVDSNGKITAISAGIATITAATVDGGFKATLQLTVEALKINSINDINKVIYQWDNYSLPETVLVNMNNGSQINKAVVWDSQTVDSSVVGKKTYKGTVEGYEGKVTLNLNVKSIQTDLILTGRSYTLIGSYFYSYGITLTSNLTEELNIAKVEIYDNGNLTNTFTKDVLAANNIPTVINPYSQWSIGLSFRFGISQTNSYFIVYINRNGHEVPCVYQLTQ